jgi:hypothetical protein
MILALHPGPLAGLVLISAFIVVFVVVPLIYSLALRLLEPRPDGRGALSARWRRRREAPTGEWGRDDAGLIASAKERRVLPHQQRTRWTRGPR